MNLRSPSVLDHRVAGVHPHRKNARLTPISLMLCIVITSCSTPITLPLAVAPTSSTSHSGDYIRLGPKAAVPATLTSNVPGTAFKISGVHPSADIVLPATDVAKVILPVAEITINASSKCYPDIVHHVQIGSDDNNIPIDFIFSNAERRPNCDDEVGRSRLLRELLLRLLTIHRN